ncbi:MAG: hypothetical protein LLG00_16515 [Planctomycetaceae bacterium]|nr:hypothetical protein [Planctomycetaceae bacterium]
MKRIMLLGLLAGVLATTTGCGLFQAVFCCRPCNMRGDCGSGVCDGCDDGGGPTCGPRCGPVRRVAGARAARVYGDDCCTSCGRACRSRCRTCGMCGDCDTCGDPCGDTCYGRPWHRGPLSCLFALFSPCTWCGRGCGDRYWGDFYSDPPDCWDPCDCHGNYMGGGNGHVSGRGGYVEGPVGYGGEGNGYVSGGNGGGGCRHCNGGHGGYTNNGAVEGMTSSGERMISQSDRVVGPAQRSAAQPHKAAKPYAE